MSLISSLRPALAAAALLAAWSSPSHALCIVTTADYAGGPFGAQVVASPGTCFRTPVGGAGEQAVTESSTGRSASADLSTGVITAWSKGGVVSAAMWDTVTFSGLPAEGGLITAKLTLTGNIEPQALGWVRLAVAPTADALNDPAHAVTQLIQSTDPFPSAVSLDFKAHNGDSLLVFTGLTADSYGGLADLADPPTLRFVLPAQASFTSSSGVLMSVTPAVPEPASLLMMAVGLAVLVGRRRVA